MSDDKDADDIMSEAVLSILLQQQAPIQPEQQRVKRIRDRLLNRVRVEKNHPDVSEHPLSLVTLRATEGEWIDVGPGVELKLLRSDADSRSYLLRLHPGGRIPPHRHVDIDEECIVLEGEAAIGSLRLTQGDYHLAPRGVPHDWLSSDTGALLFLRADTQTHFIQA